MKEEFGKTMRNTITLCHKIKMNLKRLMYRGKKGQSKTNHGKNKTKNSKNQKTYSQKKPQKIVERQKKKRGKKEKQKTIVRNNNIIQKDYKQAKHCLEGK